MNRAKPGVLATDPKRRRSLLAVCIVCAVIWAGFLKGEICRPPSIPRAGSETQMLSQRHAAIESGNPLVHAGPLRYGGRR